MGTAIQATGQGSGNPPVANTNVYPLDSFTGTDDQKMTSALAAVFAAGKLGLTGGTIQLAARSHTFANQWTTAFSAGVITTLRIIGAGAAPNGSLQAPGSGATTVTFTYSGAGNGDMDFEHLGLLEIAGINFVDTVNSVPFCYSTYPVLDVHDCNFTGVGSALTCTKDAFILGSPVGTPGQIFQGYGSRIYGCEFDSIRVITWFNAAANAVTVFNNAIATTCGNAANFGAPFILNGISTDVVSGNQIYGNTIEMIGYQCCVFAQAYASQNLIGPNSLYDNNAVTQYAAADATSTYNTVNDLSISGSSPNNPIYDPTLTCTNVTTNNAPVWARGQLLYTSAIAPAYYSESIFGGQAGWLGSGPNVTGWPTAAVVSTNTPTYVTDVATIIATPFVTSASANFILSDVGHNMATLNAGVPGLRIVWAWTHSSFGINWQPSAAAALGSPILPTTHNGHLYQCTTAGTTGASQPTWPTGGGTVTDGTAVWTDLGTSVSMAQVSGNATATSTSNPCFFGRTASTKQMTSFRNHHINGSGGAPTWTATGAGSGYTAVSVGNDIGHVLTLTTGTGSTAGIVLTGATSNSLYQTAGTFSITPNNAAAAALMNAAAGEPWIVISGQSGWVLTIPGTPADGTVYKFCILMLG